MLKIIQERQEPNARTPMDKAIFAKVAENCKDILNCRVKGSRSGQKVASLQCGMGVGCAGCDMSGCGQAGPWIHRKQRQDLHVFRFDPDGA